MSWKSSDKNTSEEIIPKYFVTALIEKPFALKGFVRVRALAGETAHIAALKSVILRKDGAETVREVEDKFENGAGIFLKFRGTDTPEAARALCGAEILVPRGEAAPVGPGEYYIEDLKGAELFLPDGSSAGFICDVVEGGGGFLLEVPLSTGKKCFIPFRKEFIGEISLEKRRVELLTPWILEA